METTEVPGDYPSQAPAAETIQEEERLAAAESIHPYLKFADVPVPANFKFNRSKSFTYEAGNSPVKVGRLFYSGWASLEDVVAFYQNEMANKGWSLVRVIEQDGSNLLYEKENWVCTVILSSSLGKSVIELQIGPK